eukprot:TRINITY_DN5258_c0_g2_i3.p1 TRINITY_DN5258_c0_g2~~TRINITY_DN5258_c0_g2_i3.p1  ORF type:complete len:857 (+),score=371.78 TRINITY_DN5258_c0_g2_i3:85-2655(+)
MCLLDNMAVVAEATPLRPIGPGLWTLRRTFSLGQHEKEGLTDENIRNRLASILRTKLGLAADAALCTATNPDLRALLEAAKVTEDQWPVLLDVLNGRVPLTGIHTFRISTNMTVIEAPSEGGVVLHSPVPFQSGDLERLREAVGDQPVVAMICPNLQHFTGVPSWLMATQCRKVYVPPPAFDENVVEKVRGRLQVEEGADVSERMAAEVDFVELADGDILGDTLLAYRLPGAQMAMNEVLLFHKPSNTLITADAFYGGYADEGRSASWFERVWFHVTRAAGGSPIPLSDCAMPSYRTRRVLEQGQPLTFLMTLGKFLDQCDIEQVVFSHGDDGNCPFTLEVAKRAVQGYVPLRARIEEIERELAKRQGKGAGALATADALRERLNIIKVCLNMRKDVQRVGQFATAPLSGYVEYVWFAGLLSELLSMMTAPIGDKALVKKQQPKPVAGGDFAVHMPVGDDGAGQYTAETKGCFDVIATATPMLLPKLPDVVDMAIDKTSKGAKTLRVADYGTADAGTSLGLMNELIKVCDAHAKDENLQYRIEYEDQTLNEWRSVFRHAYGDIEVRDANGAVLPAPWKLYPGRVFVSGVGLTFFEQCMPAASVDVGMSFTAMHWLSRDPIGAAATSLKGTEEYVHHAQVVRDRVRGVDVERLPSIEAHEKQAAKDWYAIMKAREAEMVSGGVFMLVNFTVSSEGHLLGGSEVGQSMYDNFGRCWKALQAEDGLISEAEVRALSFPNYYRSQEEVLAPLQGETENGPRLGFAVAEIETKVVRCPYREAWTSGKCKGMTAEEYARWFVPTTRTWSNSTFHAALSAERPAAEREEIVGRFWERYTQLVAEAPAEHGMDYVHCYAILRRE